MLQKLHPGNQLGSPQQPIWPIQVNLQPFSQEDLKQDEHVVIHEPIYNPHILTVASLNDCCPTITTLGCNPSQNGSF